ncbi:MAG: hypothetical protein ACK41C_03910 [Phenylobacterium sp.]|uniref:hypothetical protein n=1 Tax=Phenylobacterium sp. TaxID=1871053 RepID=UPI00391B0647
MERKPGAAVSQAAMFDAERSFTPVFRGALIAAALGVFAGSAVRATPAEGGVPAAPQLICLTEPQLAHLESLTAGWPARLAEVRLRDLPRG